MESVPIEKCNEKSYQKFKFSNEVLSCARVQAGGHTALSCETLLDDIIRLMVECIKSIWKSFLCFFEKFLNTFF